MPEAPKPNTLAVSWFYGEDQNKTLVLAPRFQPTRPSRLSLPRRRGRNPIKPEVRYSLNDLGTGNLREHYDALVKAGVRFYVSGMSAKARGLGPELLTNTPAEFALPDRLLKRSLAHDRQFTY